MEQSSLGELEIAESNSTIRLNDYEIHIHNTSRFFGSENFDVWDSRIQKSIGNINNVGTHINFLQPKLPYRLTAEVNVYEQCYFFENITQPKIRLNPFRRRERIYDFILKKHDESIVVKYQLKFKFPIFKRLLFFRQSAFEGWYETNGGDQILLFLGMFLIQKSFTYRFDSIE
jgi:hypothetical protein